MTRITGLVLRVIEARITVTGADTSRVCGLYRLVTSLTDHRADPATALFRLYHERWGATRNSPADRPRSRCLTETDRILQRAGHALPADHLGHRHHTRGGVNDPSDAPTRTRPATPGIFFTERVSFRIR